MQQTNEYYEKRSHKEGHLIMPVIVIAFITGSCALIFALIYLFKIVILDNMDKIDSL